MTGAPVPLLVDGDVTVGARALTVRPAATASATARFMWREAVHGQDSPAAKTVWASGAGRSQIAFGVPAGGNALEFHFHDDPVWRELASSPGLTARIAVDRASRNIIGVTFRAR